MMQSLDKNLSLPPVHYMNILTGGAYLQSEVVEKKTDKTKGDRGDINCSSEVVGREEIGLADGGGGESAEWINCLLEERWPSLHQGIFSFLSSTLAASPFPGVQIAWLNLGGAPRVGKVRVSGHRLEAIVSYFGEGGVELGLPLPGPLPSLNLALTNVHFEASVLVQLQPTLQLQLVERPYIDFNLGGLAYCLNLPGLASLTRQIVAEQIFQHVQGIDLLPSKPVTMPAPTRCRHPSPPAGVLNITVVAAEALLSLSMAVLVEVTVDGRLHRFRTLTTSETSFPSWDFLVQLPVEQVDSISDLTVKLEEEEGITTASTILSKTVVERAVILGELDFWSSLDDAHGQVSQVSGRVRTRLSWSTLGAEHSEQALVTVNLNSCSNLPPGNVVVSLTLAAVTKVSNTSVSSNCQTVFDDRVSLLVENPEEEELRVDVVNLTTERVVGSLQIPLGDVLARNAGVLHEQEFRLLQRTEEIGDEWTTDDAKDKISKESLPSVSFSLVVNYVNHSESVLRSRARCRAHNQGRLRGKSEKQEERVRRIREDKLDEEKSKLKGGMCQDIVSRNMTNRGGFCRDNGEMIPTRDVFGEQEDQVNGFSKEGNSKTTDENDKQEILDTSSDGKLTKSGKEDKIRISVPKLEGRESSDIKSKRFKRFEKTKHLHVSEPKDKIMEPFAKEERTNCIRKGDDSPPERNGVNGFVESMKRRSEECEAIKRKLLQAGVGMNGSHKQFDGISENVNGGKIQENGFLLEGHTNSQQSSVSTQDETKPKRKIDLTEVSPKPLNDDNAKTNNKHSHESALQNRHNEDESGGRKTCDGAEEKGKATTPSQHDRVLEDEEESDESKLEKGKDLEERDKDNDTADKDKYNDPDKGKGKGNDTYKTKDKGKDMARKRADSLRREAEEKTKRSEQLSQVIGGTSITIIDRDTT